MKIDGADFVNGIKSDAPASSNHHWGRLHLTYEGTNRVKETKKNILLSKYKSFKMKPDELFTDMFSRFTNIVNGVAYQGRQILSGEKVNNLLQAISKEWNNIKTSIWETQRIMPLTVDELILTLISYEAEHINDDIDSKGKVGEKELRFVLLLSSSVSIFNNLRVCRRSYYFM